MKKEKGITLISLVITIIILIILASVAIYLSIGDNGIFTRAKEAKEATNKQTATEKINLKIITAQMNKYAEEQVMPTLKELSEALRDDEEIQYVTEISKVVSAEYDVSSENPTSIYTKLNEYPYEFEINGQLQLASINGVKIANTNNSTTNEPTGLKTDIFVKNSITTTSKINGATSMSGFKREKDKNNKIDDYLEFSEETGYKVLKSGWYLIRIYSSSEPKKNGNYASCNTRFHLNGIEIANVSTCANNTGGNYDTDSFSIFLNKNDYLYFSFNSYNTETQKGICSVSPMF